MSRLPDAPICERGNDLISFLYGEVDERAARDFERHLLSCADCESALGAFKQVRSSVIAWRDESLGGAAASWFSVSTNDGRAASPDSPSAMAAIRKFFDLSPLWLKAGVAFASVVFCLVSGLALASLFEKPQPVIAEEKLYTEKQLLAKIADAVKSQLPDSGSEEPKPQSLNTVTKNQPEKGQPQSSKQPGVRVAANPKVRRAPLTKSEREQLAADLRLIVPQDDKDLDLLGEGNN